MSRVLEVPYGQLGDMTKRQAMNLSILRVDDGNSLSTTLEQARRAGNVVATTDPSASMNKSRLNHKFDEPAQATVRDSAFARWEVVALPPGLNLDEVLQQVVKINTRDKKERILKIKVRFSDASEITFVRQSVDRADSLRYAGFYSALEGNSPTKSGGPAGSINPLSSSASAAFQRRAPTRLPDLNAVENPTKEQRIALFRRFDPNGNGRLSLAELDKAVGELWPKFDNKPALMRAYKAADLDGSGLLSVHEFEHFLRYLVNYNKVWLAFRKMDANSDRRIDQAEFVAGAKRLEPGKTDAELIAMFKKLDKNNGGYILFDEFCAAMVEKRSNVMGHIPPQPIDRIPKLAPATDRGASKTRRVTQLDIPTAAKRKQLFARFDPNGNGMLSLAELDKAVGELWPAFNNKPALMRAYKAADANKTGFVSKGEFEYFLRYLVHFNNLWAAFCDSDSDGDRRISLQEFLAVRTRLQVGTEAEARQAFSAMDRNRGGYVLFEEFCDWMAKHKAEYEIKFTQPAPRPSKPKAAVPPAPKRTFELDNASDAAKPPSAADKEAL